MTWTLEHDGIRIDGGGGSGGALRPVPADADAGFSR